MSSPILDNFTCTVGSKKKTISMENLNNFHNIQFLILLLLQFSSLSLLLSSAYTPPDKFFINCGSDSNATLSDRTFVSDVNPGSYSFSPGTSSILKAAAANSLSGTPSIYQTARIYKQPSSYEIEIPENGTYFLRLHFSPFSSPTTDLSTAVFDVSASGSLLLSNFSLRNGIDLPSIKEFLLFVDVGKFRINFTPSTETLLAFVNAIELFLAPGNAVSDSGPLVTLAGRSNSPYSGLVSSVLHPVHRINVGGPALNDSLWRNWVPDDDYLFNKNAAKNSDYYRDRPKYQTGGASEYTAPDLVYQTAKQLNIINSTGTNQFFNITWRFNVSKNAKHFVRVHFCDIISPSVATINFYFFIYGNFSEDIDPYERISQLAAPFCIDYVVESDNSGFIYITIGPKRGSTIETAFLNGLEIMELIQESGTVPPEGDKSNKNSLFIIIGSVVGGVGGLICILIVVVVLWFKCRKAKPVENSDWRYQEPSSYSRITEGTVNASPVPNLNLGLKISFSEILYATNGFDPKLVIGEGGFGKVYKGTRWSGEKVAVKRCQPGRGQGLPEFQTEIMVLSRIRHHHLVSLIGYCEERSEMILVYEFMEKGTLRDHLYGDSEKSRSELSWKQRLEICIGSARGLHYLHTGSAGGIIHRDVKSTNILLDENYVAKVADFGLSKSGPLDQSQTHVSTAVKGSFGYLDPEYFRCMQLTDKSDVYSFGVVLLEVLCARPAINASLPREQVNLAEWGMFWQTKGELEKIIDPLLVGKINLNSLRKFGETAEKCLNEYGVDRPVMGDVLWDLEYALQLQKTAVLREPHEDSTTDASLELPQRAVQRLPSYSLPIDEEEQSFVQDNSGTTASEVFSQLRIDDAR